MKVHHRCSRCKQESYPRYKYKKSGVAGVFCESCMSIIRFGEPVRRPSLLSRLWTQLVDFLDRVIHPRTHKVELKMDATRVYTRMKVLEGKARSIPSDIRQAAPQKM